ncbi:hypothetical protein [uncultured Dubosiella sp.]|uniref:hypothetical protein n=1 Tax=uncultured Dubosiella sp. TaxID=1937011 RepID=UPI0025B2B827|nr:hypothetical protein [uncultured Dubosiella sp.]
MKKRRWILSLLLAGSLWIEPVFAETMQGKDNWAVSFTKDEKMASNFSTASIDDVLYEMQPGDNAVIHVAIRNENKETTDWYMSNDVLRSLEDTVDVASGGAYTYRLTYTGANGREQVLFDSQSVGGEGENKAGVGLNAATDALDEYFFLDTLKQNQRGTVDLEVALDGETQGNNYQSTLADLEMRFAVELNDARPSSSTGRTTRSVDTSAYAAKVPWLVLSGASGVILLCLALFGWKKNREAK